MIDSINREISIKKSERKDNTEKVDRQKEGGYMYTQNTIDKQIKERSIFFGRGGGFKILHF